MVMLSITRSSGSGLASSTIYLLQSFLEIQKMLITPYVPNVVDAKNPQAILERASIPRSERNITVYFRGKCTPQTERYIGKKMRHALV